MDEDEQRYAGAIEKAKRSLVDYRHIMLVSSDHETDPASYHFRWGDILLNGTGNDAIEGFRESGKTQYVLRAFMLYALQFPSARRDYIVIIKKNTRLAGQKLKEIQSEYLSNPAVSANCIKIVEQSADSFSVDVRGPGGESRNIRIEAYGKGASIRGLANVYRRPKIVIIDDPQDVEDASSPTVQQSDWDWFLSDVMFLGQKTRIFAIGNNLGEACILERIAANADELGFTFARQPTLVNDESAWPSKITTEEILKEKRSFERLGKLDIWLREKMCVATSDETRIFQKDDFQYFNVMTAPRLRPECNAYMVVDPATSLSDASDYRAMLVGFVNHENLWFFPECVYGRKDTMWVIDEMFRLVVTWGLRDVGIEEGIYEQAIKPFLLKEMQKRNQFFNVIPLKHGGKAKADRIRMLQPRFKAHSILFPEPGQVSWTTEMESELLAFTMAGMRGLHDDLIDCLAYFEQIARVPYKSTMRHKNLPRIQEDNHAYI